MPHHTMDPARFGRSSRWLKFIGRTLVRSRLVAAILWAFGSDLHAQLRVLPLGDSITQGDSAHNSYRRILWHMLNDAGYTVDLIGSMTTSSQGTAPPNPDFDLHHEGHAGWHADEILNGRSGQGNLALWLATYTPEVVLLHIGSNDATNNGGGANFLNYTVDETKQIIALLRQDNPNVKILLAQILPIYDDWMIPEINDFHTNERIDAFNAEIPNIAAALSMRIAPVAVCGRHTHLTRHSDTSQACGFHTLMKKTRRATARNIIGGRVREARRRAKPPVSQEDLAGKLAAQGVLLDRSAISRVESQDRYLMDYEIAALAKALKVSVAWLFGEKG